MITEPMIPGDAFAMGVVCGVAFLGCIVLIYVVWCLLKRDQVSTITTSSAHTVRAGDLLVLNGKSYTVRRVIDARTAEVVRS